MVFKTKRPRIDGGQIKRIKSQMVKDSQSNATLYFTSRQVKGAEGSKRTIVKTQKEYAIYLKQMLEGLNNVSQSTISRYMDELSCDILNGKLVMSAESSLDILKEELKAIFELSPCRFKPVSDSFIFFETDTTDVYKIKKILKELYKGSVLSVFIDDEYNLLILCKSPEATTSVVQRFDEDFPLRRIE